MRITDKALAAILADSEQGAAPGIGDTQLMLREIKLSRVEMKSLKAECEGLREDADRYRWLRAQNWNQSEMAVVCQPKGAIKLGYDCPFGERLDAAIDAANTCGSGEGSKVDETPAQQGFACRSEQR